MIVSSYIQMPVAGVPDAAMVQKAIDGSAGAESGIAYSGMSGFSGLGYDPGYDPEPALIGPADSVSFDPNTVFSSPGYNIDTSNIGMTLATGDEQQAAYQALQTEYSTNPTEFTGQGLPTPTTKNVVAMGSPGQSSAAWQQAMVTALIKSGGQIMNNVTMPAGMLAVKNANGSVTYYRQPTGNTTNLPVGAFSGAQGTPLGVGPLGVTGNISSSTILLIAALGFGFMYMQQRRG